MNPLTWQEKLWLAVLVISVVTGFGLTLFAPV